MAQHTRGEPSEGNGKAKCGGCIITSIPFQARPNDQCYDIPTAAYTAFYFEVSAVLLLAGAYEYR